MSHGYVALPVPAGPGHAHGAGHVQVNSELTVAQGNSLASYYGSTRSPGPTSESTEFKLESPDPVDSEPGHRVLSPSPSQPEPRLRARR